MIVQLHHTLQGGNWPPRWSGPNSEEKLNVQKQLDNPGMLFTQHLDNKDTVDDGKTRLWRAFQQYPLKNHIFSDSGKLWKFITDANLCKLGQSHLLDAGFDVVFIRCSEVAHGVCWICQTGMECEMHGLWIRHDCRRLLLLSPPQTRCLWVQIPLCRIQQTMGWHLTK